MNTGKLHKSYLSFGVTSKNLKWYCKVELAVKIVLVVIYPVNSPYHNRHHLQESSRQQSLFALHLSISLWLEVPVENLLRPSRSQAEVGCADGQPVLLPVKPRCSV